MPASTTLLAELSLLQEVHPVFLQAEIPPIEEDAEARIGDHHAQPSPEESDDVANIENSLGLLRPTMKMNNARARILKQHRDNQKVPPRVWNAIEAKLRLHLGALEQLVDSSVLENVSSNNLDSERLETACLFPKLLALQGRLRGLCGEIDVAQNVQPEPARAMHEWPTEDVPEQDMEPSPLDIAKLANLIRWPDNARRFEMLRKTATSLSQVIRSEDIFSGAEEQELASDFTSFDMEVIENAHTFANMSTSLFEYMAEGCKRCESPHQAKLHLSGFKENSLRFNISTCEESSWVPAVFKCSTQQPSHAPTPFENLCSPVLEQMKQPHFEVQQVIFNSNGMWSMKGSSMTWPDKIQQASPEDVLVQILADRDRLAPKYRKLVEVLLAACVFQLNESPWTEQYLNPDDLFVPPLDTKQLHQWCPHLLCDLKPRSFPTQQSDNIAALGVLVLELEVCRRAAWTSADKDWPAGDPSNHTRLARILVDWQDSVYDDYRKIAKACLEFDVLVARLDNSKIPQERRGIAVIYKYILSPLIRSMANSFMDLLPLIEDMFGPSRGLTTATERTAQNTAKFSLFDDDEIAVLDEKLQGSAKMFMTELGPFFDRIEGLHKQRDLMQFPQHNKIRIAVLDSGVDGSDRIIYWAKQNLRISKKSKSFTGDGSDWAVDVYGHGTHVTKLLLKAAPAAEIYVARICTGKAVNSESMTSIASAIKWATEEVDAHILSMSFGFKDEHEEIQAALKNALKADKLIIAAASNNGGLSGRARPARTKGVICMHATDGKGNKASFNPSPASKKDNFATLGVAVPSRWEGTNVWKSGTSFAVPIAVGFAAGILELAKYKMDGVKQSIKDLLYTEPGMSAVFKAMTEERDGYDFLHPGKLAEDWQDNKAVAEATRTIANILVDL